MICPSCLDQSLAAHHRGGIQIDICPKCHGVWLDRGELNLLAFSPPAPSGAAFHGPAADQPQDLDHRHTDRDDDDDDDDDVNDRRDRDDDDRDEGKHHKQNAEDRKKGKPEKKKPKEKASIGDRLGEVIDEIFDDFLDF